ncbi:MAG: START domain-containing protein [Myxococcales bacterium]|nr:hypothetical protein [Myxococcales bacterium]HIK83676.1 hypothetical protein [Myxococcales bacterium]
MIRNTLEFSSPAAVATGARVSTCAKSISTRSGLILIMSVSLAWTASPAFAERSVVLVEEGITVESDLEEGRTLPIMIGTTTMNANAEQIASWVTAVHTYVDWQHSCNEARVLKQPDGSRLTYNRVASPWPVSDRDVVLRSSREELEGGGIRLEFRSTEDAKLDTTRGVVRMPRLIGSYVLTPTAEGGTHVVYTVDSDPGGSLPAWLIKQAGKDLPYRTLKNLKARAEAGPAPPQ